MIRRWLLLGWAWSTEREYHNSGHHEYALKAYVHMNTVQEIQQRCYSHKRNQQHANREAAVPIDQRYKRCGADRNPNNRANQVNCCHVHRLSH